MKFLRKKSRRKIWINLVALYRIASEQVAQNDVEAFDYLTQNIMSIAVELKMPCPADWKKYVQK